MRRLFSFFSFIAILAAMPAYSGSIVNEGRTILAERQSSEVKVVMYMTSW